MNTLAITEFRDTLAGHDLVGGIVVEPNRLQPGAEVTLQQVVLEHPVGNPDDLWGISRYNPGQIPGVYCEPFTGRVVRPSVGMSKADTFVISTETENDPNGVALPAGVFAVRGIRSARGRSAEHEYWLPSFFRIIQEATES